MQKVMNRKQVRSKIRELEPNKSMVQKLLKIIAFLNAEIKCLKNKAS